MSVSEVNWRFILLATAAVGSAAFAGYVAAILTSPKTSVKKQKKIKLTSDSKEDKKITEINPDQENLTTNLDSTNSHNEKSEETMLNVEETENTILLQETKKAGDDLLKRSSNSTVVDQEEMNTEVLESTTIFTQDTVEESQDLQTNIQMESLETFTRTLKTTDQVETEATTISTLIVDSVLEENIEKKADTSDFVETGTTAESEDHVEKELSSEEKQKLSAQHKEKGNEFFKSKKYKEAIEQYSKAIDLLPTAVYYGNRAACYNALGDMEKVIEDCNQALSLDDKYIKAYSRRAQAYEKINKKTDALNDLTIACILLNFKQDAMAATDRLLRDIANEKLPQVLENKTPRLPSHSFVETFLESFKRTRKDMTELACMQTENPVEEQLVKIFKLILAGEYSEAFSHLETVEKGAEMSSIFKNLLYNMYATFQYIIGNGDGALEALETALKINPKDVDSLVKKATVMMEKGDVQGTLSLYDQAEREGPNHVDVYYHRGQLNFLSGNFAGAIEDYKKALEIEPDFIYAMIQLGVAQYKAGSIGDSMKTFNRTTRKFPHRAEVFIYHGEIMTDQGKFEDAVNMFTKASEIKPSSPLPYVNQGILTAQWKQDYSGAESLIRKAIEVDPACDIAYVHLGQVMLAQNKIPGAIEVYEKAMEYARSEMDLINLIMCKEAAEAQRYVAQNYPMMLANLMMTQMS